MCRIHGSAVACSPAVRSMSDVTVRLRRSEGLVEVVPTSAPLDRPDRWLAMFTVCFAATGLFVGGALPPQAVAVTLACCIAGELGVMARSLALLRRPPAEVHELPRRRFRR
jgi:hypothetical protein